MERKKGVVEICYQVVLIIYKKMHLWKIPVPGRDRVKTDLSRLYPGENQEERITEYYVRKLTMSLMIFFVGILLILFVVLGKSEGNSIKNGWMKRADSGSGSKDYVIIGKVEDGSQYSFALTVQPRKYRQEKLQKLFDAFREELPGLICGGNESLDCVREDLQLQEEYDDYPFTVTWKSDCMDVISPEGKVYPQEQDSTVRLKAGLAYDEYQWETETSVTVKNQSDAIDKSEKAVLEIMLENAQTSDPEHEAFMLPESIDGKKVSWRQRSLTELQLLLGTLVTIVAVFFFKDRDIHELVEKKKQEEKRKYPEILQKITLYLEAGLTVRAAVNKIAEDYEQTRRKGAKEQAAYEELLIAVREIRMGVSEGAAYEKFGKRTGVREYIRLSTFLTQNVKKGSTMLLQQLREEAKEAEEMRMRNARKLCEEASTKLLLPMIMLLLVVMILIMFPAFSNVGV